MKRTWVLAGLLGAWACVSAVMAEPVALTPRVTDAALYKHGYGYVTASVTLPAGAGDIAVGELPEAALGTFWFEPLPDGTHVSAVRRESRKETMETPAATIADLIRLNANRRVRLLTDQDELSGVLLGSVAPAPDRDTEETPAGIPVKPLAADSLCLLRTDDGGTVALRTPEIRRLVLLEDGVFTEPVERDTWRLACTLSGPCGGGELRMHYLVYGLSWIPAYEIGLRDDDTARVVFRGTILNDAVSLDGCAVSFVAGHPNFRLRTVQDALLSPLPIAEFYSALQRAFEPAGRYDGGMTTQSPGVPWFVSNSPGPVEQVRVQPQQVELDGSFEEDMFFYAPVHATLERGERGAFLIGKHDVPCEHVYLWEVSDMAPRDWGGSGEGLANPAADAQTVWHSLRLTNASGAPWTTGSVLVTRGGNPISQDVLQYTPPGAVADFRLTKALGVTASSQDQETNRRNNVIRRYLRGGPDEIVTVRGVMRIRNNENDTVRVVIKKRFVGTLLETAPEAKVSKSAENIRSYNPAGEMEWQADLAPGEEKEFTYSLDMLVY